MEHLSTKDYVIIVAGGRGMRMGAELPKQFLPLKGKPVLMHTIEAFHRALPAIEIIVVLPADQHTLWKELCEKCQFVIPHKVATGGDTRFASSRAGLALVPDDARGVVAFHDGVRPLVSAAVVQRCVEAARREKAVIPVIPVTSTLRRVDALGGSCTVRRDEYREVQTPQCFNIQVAKQAFCQPESTSFTDDASVVEALGVGVKMVEGEPSNIKLTTPSDLQIAEALMGGL